MSAQIRALETLTKAQKEALLAAVSGSQPGYVNYTENQNFIEVVRFEQWGRDYLTVANNWDGLCSEVVKGELPPLLAVVTAINGITTKDMSREEFYREAANGTVVLDYLVKLGGKNVQKQVELMPKNYHLAFTKLTAPIGQPININIVNDTEVDYFDYNTFDVVATGDDKLVDKNILDILSQPFIERGMKRDSKNPDVIFTVEKSLQQTTNSVYVPESQQVVTTGFTTTYGKNKKTGKAYTTTTAKNKVYRSGGYTHTGVSATFHLSFSILKNDTTKTLEEKPVIWKLDYNRFASTAINVIGEASSQISFWCAQYPFNKPTFSYELETSGIAFESEEAVKTGEVLDVLPESNAYSKGLRGGDRILKVYAPGVYALILGQTKVTHFNVESQKKQTSSAYLLFGFIPIGTYKYENCAVTGGNYLTEDRGGSTRRKFKVLKKETGKKTKIKAPFKAMTRNYEYIY